MATSCASGERQRYLPSSSDSVTVSCTRLSNVNHPISGIYYLRAECIKTKLSHISLARRPARQPLTHSFPRQLQWKVEEQKPTSKPPHNSHLEQSDHHDTTQKVSKHILASTMPRLFDFLASLEHPQTYASCSAGCKHIFKVQDEYECRFRLWWRAYSPPIALLILQHKSSRI